MLDQIEDTIKKFTLQNAVFFKGTANQKAVIGKIFSVKPELRQRSREIVLLTDQIIKDVNSMELNAQIRQLNKIDSSMLIKEKKQHKHELPDLDGVDGDVTMRIAPGPSGPLHIGHTRVSILNDEYVNKYDGTLILRFEDTNPEKIDPNAYDMIQNDLGWLGVKCHKTYFQSDRFDIYYKYTGDLVRAGHAYVCSCDRDHWRKLKENKQACPCRNIPIETQLERYDKFIAGEYDYGKAVVVVKTDIYHPNPAIRDFVALRLVSHPHPRTGERYIAYPMMNLSVAIDDHEMGMTHVIRGKDHLNNTLRQGYIFDYFGWKKPVYYHNGLVNIPDTILKTSLIKQGILSGKYSGWDDVRSGTVMALKRRGIRPEAIRKYWVESGMKPVDIQFSWDNLYGINRSIIDDISNRYFFVQDPVRCNILGINSLTGSAPLHPGHPNKGNKNYFIDSPITVFISTDDYKLFKRMKEIRLKDLCNIGYQPASAQYINNDVSVLKRGVHAIQWVSNDSIKANLTMPNGTVINGLVESAILSEKLDIVQLERVGFAKIEELKGDNVKLVFTHR